jgi:hypothetical protein
MVGGGWWGPSTGSVGRSFPHPHPRFANEFQIGSPFIFAADEVRPEPRVDVLRLLEPADRAREPVVMKLADLHGVDGIGMECRSTPSLLLAHVIPYVRRSKQRQGAVGGVGRGGRNWVSFWQTTGESSKRSWRCMFWSTSHGRK